MIVPSWLPERCCSSRHHIWQWRRREPVEELAPSAPFIRKAKDFQGSPQKTSLYIFSSELGHKTTFQPSGLYSEDGKGEGGEIGCWVIVNKTKTVIWLFVNEPKACYLFIHLLAYLRIGHWCCLLLSFSHLSLSRDTMHFQFFGLCNSTASPLKFGTSTNCFSRLPFFFFFFAIS